MWFLVTCIVVLLAATLFRPLSLGLLRAVLLLICRARREQKGFRLQPTEYNTHAPTSEQTTICPPLEEPLAPALNDRASRRP